MRSSGHSPWFQSRPGQPTNRMPADEENGFCNANRGNRRVEAVTCYRQLTLSDDEVIFLCRAILDSTENRDPEGAQSCRTSHDTSGDSGGRQGRGSIHWSGDRLSVFERVHAGRGDKKRRSTGRAASLPKCGPSASPLFLLRTMSATVRPAGMRERSAGPGSQRFRSRAPRDRAVWPVRRLPEITFQIIIKP